VNDIEKQISFLFSRVTWPSGMVRERTCTEIAKLIIDDRFSQPTYNYLLEWLQSQTLESIAAIGLLIFYRAIILDKRFSLPSESELASVINKPSILSWILTNELTTNRLASPDWGSLNSGTAPNNFSSNSFFGKYSQIFLPSIYTDRAYQIEKKNNIPFMHQWMYEWQKLLENLGKEPKIKPLDFRGWPDRDHYVAIDFELSEIYRSSYLRALAWSIMIGVLSEDEGEYLALETCPIDLGLWRIKPLSRPDWWPQVEEPKGQIDTLPGQIWSHVENLWNKQIGNNNWIIAEAEGRVFEGQSFYDLTIHGIFQICRGSQEPDLEEILEWIHHLPRIRYIPPSLKIDGEIEKISTESLENDFGDWSILPVACRVKPYTVPRWQFWRCYRDVWTIATYFNPHNWKLQCSELQMTISVGEEVVGKWNDWTNGLKEKLTANLPPASGQCLQIDRKIIEEFAKKTNSTFCWVCSLTGYYRKYEYGSFEIFSDYRQFGSSTIVHP